MSETKHIKDVGAPDPELKTSAIAEENDAETLRQEIPGEPVCYFNNQDYTTGTYIKSGSLLLKCDYGIWIPAGPADPDNP